MSTLTLAALIIAIALVFDYINGFHDAANSIATIVATRVLTPFQAVLWAAFFNFAAAFFFGTKVSDAGIARLAAIKSLKKIFLWQTAVTQDGAKNLEASVPGIVVNIGLSEAEIAKLIEETKPPQIPEPAKPAAKKPEAKTEAKPAPAKPEAKPAAKPAAPNNPPAPPVKTEKK